MSISVEKRLISAASAVMDQEESIPLRSAPQKATISIPKTNNHTFGMSACLLVMDDTIKLTEWLAYHYTVLPLSHLIVAIDPQSSKDIQGVLNRWKPHLQHLEVWTHDTWMSLNATEGWPTSAYSRNGRLVKRRIRRNPHLEHKRRQEHFVVQCMRRLKSLDTSSTSWVVLLDTDEFLVYNYIGPHEDASFFLSNSTVYQHKTRKLRRLQMSVRKQLPSLHERTIGEFLQTKTTKPCIKIPGLQISAKESHLSQVMRQVPSKMDARVLMTMRHRHYGNKYGRFSKCLIDLQRLSFHDLQQDQVRTIHNPLAKICGKHANQYIGIDYISSILRLHHHAGTAQSFHERLHDARVGRNASFTKRNVEPLGETDDVRPWISMFVNEVGVEEAQRLLYPLQEAYRETDWNDVWNVDGIPVDTD